MENRASFGQDATQYRKYRPRYPGELYAYIASLCTQRSFALDCATGNGQAAVGLATHFQKVIAFDFSEAQIREAMPVANIDYRVSAAEDFVFPGATFDLVAVAQAVHWFDLPVFYERVRECTGQGAVMAIWGYSHCSVSPEIDAIMHREIIEAVDPYWAEGNRIIMDHYQSIEFPFREIATPAFTMGVAWPREDLVGYMRTWSAYKRCVEEEGSDPVARFERALDDADVWPSGRSRRVSFEIALRAGYIHR
jgi:hypothetical protein